MTAALSRYAASSIASLRPMNWCTSMPGHAKTGSNAVTMPDRVCTHCNAKIMNPFCFFSAQAIKHEDGLLFLARIANKHVVRSSEGVDLLGTYYYGVFERACKEAAIANT